MDHASDKSLIAAFPWWRPDLGTNLVIRSGSRLVGIHPISGAKNAVLPLMVSALLTPHLATLHNVPASLDVAVLSNLLQRLGVGLSWSSSGRTDLSLTLCADQVHPARIDGDLAGRMRASVLLLGTVPARCGEACLPMPGGDALGCAASTSASQGCAPWVPRSRSRAAPSTPRHRVACKARRSRCRSHRWVRRRTCCWLPCWRTAGPSSATRRASLRLLTWCIAWPRWGRRSKG